MLQQIPRLPPVLPPQLQPTRESTCHSQVAQTGAAQGLLKQVAAMEAQQQQLQHQQRQHIPNRIKDSSFPDSPLEPDPPCSHSDPEKEDSDDAASDGPWPTPNPRPKQWLPRLMRRSSSGSNAKEVLLRVDGCTVLVHDGPLYVDNVMRLFPNHVVIPASAATATSSAGSSRSTSPNQCPVPIVGPTTSGESQARSPSRSPLRSRLGLAGPSNVSSGPLTGRKPSPFRTRSTTGAAPLPAGRILMPGQKYDLVPAKSTVVGPIPASCPKPSSGTSGSPPHPVASSAAPVATVPAHQTGGITVPVKSLRDKQSRLKGAYPKSASASASDTFPVQNMSAFPPSWEGAPEPALRTGREAQQTAPKQHPSVQVLQVEGNQGTIPSGIPRAASLPSAQPLPEEVLRALGEAPSSQGQHPSEPKQGAALNASRLQGNTQTQAQSKIPSRQQLLQHQQQLEQLQQQVQALKLTRSGSQHRYSSPQAQPALGTASPPSLPSQGDTPTLPTCLGVSLGSAVPSSALAEAMSAAAASMQNPSMRRCSSLRASTLASVNIGTLAPPSTFVKPPQQGKPPLGEDPLSTVQMLPLAARGVSVTGKPPKAFPPPTGPTLLTATVQAGTTPNPGSATPPPQPVGRQSPSPGSTHRRASSLIPIACAEACTPFEPAPEEDEGRPKKGGGGHPFLGRSRSSRSEVGFSSSGMEGGWGEEEEGPPTPRMGTGAVQRRSSESGKSPRSGKSTPQKDGVRDRPAKGHFEKQRVAPVPLLSPRGARMSHLWGGGDEGKKQEKKTDQKSRGCLQEDEGVEEGNPTFEIWKAKQEKKHRLFFSPGRAWMLGKDRQEKREREREKRCAAKSPRGGGRGGAQDEGEEFSWDGVLSAQHGILPDVPSPRVVGEGVSGVGEFEGEEDLPFSAAEMYMSGVHRNNPSPPRLWAMLSPKRGGRDSAEGLDTAQQGNRNRQVGPAQAKRSKSPRRKEVSTTSPCTSPPAELETALQNFRSRLEAMDEDGSTATRGRRARGVPGAGDTWRPALEDVDEDRSFRAINVATPERRRRNRFLSFNL